MISCVVIYIDCPSSRVNLFAIHIMCCADLGFPQGLKFSPCQFYIETIKGSFELLVDCGCNYNKFMSFDVCWVAFSNDICGGSHQEDPAMWLVVRRSKPQARILGQRVKNRVVT